MTKCLVIGSSFAGVFAAMPLVEAGYDVEMIDPGIDLERGRFELVEELAVTSPDLWDQEKVAALKGEMKATADGVDQKLLFGSDYPYRTNPGGPKQPVVCHGAKVMRSFAQGGFSNVWGGSIMPFCEEEIRDWGVPYSDLESSYRHVMSIAGEGCVSDDLDTLLPTFRKNESCIFPLSSQTRGFYSDIQRHAEYLQRIGIYYGQARIAAGNGHEVPKCRKCGLCLYGCVYECLFTTRALLRKLSECRNFTYTGGLVVDKIEENPSGAFVHCRDSKDGASVICKADRIYLGAGVVSSTRILLASKNAYDRPVVMRHSDHFQLPLLRIPGCGGITKEYLTTVSQLALEVKDPEIDSALVHLQVYGYNDLYEQVLRKKLSGPLKPLQHLIGQVLDRLFIIKGYVHSDKSSHMLVSLKQGVDGALHVVGERNPAASRIASRVASKIASQGRRLKLLTSPFLVGVGEPGLGNHSGGTFPMAADPGEFQCDILGRPSGFSRVHVVDSTIFPSIPATTITLTIMANAHRIATSSLRD